MGKTLDPKASHASGMNGQSYQYKLNKQNKRRSWCQALLSLLCLLFAALIAYLIVRYNKQKDKVDMLENNLSRSGIVSTSNQHTSVGGGFLLSAVPNEQHKIKSVVSGDSGNWFLKKSLNISFHPLHDMQVVHIPDLWKPSVQFANQFLVLGGQKQSGVLPQVSTYNPQLDLFKFGLVPDMPSPRTRFAAVLVNKYVLVFGGTKQVSQDSTSHIYSNMSLYDVQNNEWSERQTSMKTPRIDFCAVVIDDVVYAAGGLDSNGKPIDTIEQYSFEDDSWEEVAQLPSARSGVACTVSDGIIYIAGGKSGGADNSGIENYSNDLLAFNPSQGTVRRLAPMLYKRSSAALTTLGSGNILVQGGETAHNSQRGMYALSNTEEYVISRDYWLATPPMQLPRHRFGVAVYDGSPYVFGGFTKCGTGFLESCPESATEKVEQFRQMPEPKLYLMQDPDHKKEVEIIKEDILLEQNAYRKPGFTLLGSIASHRGYWLEREPLKQAIGGFGVARVIDPEFRGEYIVFGGVTYDKGDKVVDKTWISQEVLQQYKSAQTMPTPLHSFGHTQVGDKVYVAGGSDDATSPTIIPSGDTFVYDIGEDKWSKLGAKLVTPRLGHCMAEINGVLYVAGGVDRNETILDSIEAFEPGMDSSWRELTAHMAIGRVGAKCAALQNALHLIGGFGKGTEFSQTQFRPDHEVYSPVSNKILSAAPLPVGLGDFAATVVEGRSVLVMGGLTQSLEQLKYENGGAENGEDGEEGDAEEGDKETEAEEEEEAANNGEKGIGGSPAQGIASNRVFEYMPDLDLWIERAAMPNARFGGEALVLDDGGVYIMGGYGACLQDCRKAVQKSKYVYLDLDTPDIFMYAQT